MNKPLRKVVLLTASLAALAGSQHAVAGFMPYLGAGAGYGYTDLVVNPQPSKSDQAGFVWNGNAGVLFTKNIGLDFGYFQFSNIKMNGSDVVTRNTMFTMALKGILYGQEGMSLFAKAGVAKAYLRYVSGPSVQKYVPYGALGVGYQIMNHLTLEVSANATMAEGSNDGSATPNRIPANYAGIAGLTYTF